MSKVHSITPEHAEAVVDLAVELEGHAEELLELSRLLRDQIEFSGEMHAEIVKRLARVVETAETTLNQLVDLGRGSATAIR